MSVSAFATLPVVPVVIGSPVMPADSSGEDVGPLAWVLVEIRKSVDGAVKSLWRQAQDGPGDGPAGINEREDDVVAESHGARAVDVHEGRRARADGVASHQGKHSGAGEERQGE